MIHSFLLSGQSNMAGRGFQREVPVICDEDIKVLRNGRWHMMTEPVHYDRPAAGVGLAGGFAAAWHLANPGAAIGLIPCADGGTSIDDWTPGSALFDHAVAQARLAQRSSTLSGILWHQGESDCFPDRALAYREKLEAVLAAFRQELRAEDTPIVLGGLGDYLTGGMYGAYFTSYPLINAALRACAVSGSNTWFVSAAGLGANPDGVHMDAVSLRRFGLRYFDAFHNRRHVDGTLADESEQLERIHRQPLSIVARKAILENGFASGQIGIEAFTAAMAAL